MTPFIHFVGLPNAAAAHEGPLTVDGTVRTLASLITGGLHADTRFVRVSVEDDDVRLTVDGTAPNATKGRKLLADADVLLSRGEADGAKLVRVTNNAKIQVTQYRE